MPAISATAPGKVILIGEHAVVYNRPAIAVPVNQVRTKTTILALPKRQPDEVWLEAPEVGLSTWLKNLPETHPLSILLSLIKSTFSIQYLPAMRIMIHSTIPVAGGLGSGAAVSVSVIRACSAFLGHPLPNPQVSALAYEVEKHHHGTPSGIDNTVITYGKPVFFKRDSPIEFILPNRAFTLVIADSGVKSLTAAAVSGVRQRWQAQPSLYEDIFEQIGHIVKEARQSIESGEILALGSLMNKNHTLLRNIGVSSVVLDSLVDAALSAGAWGAKLSGGGQGGNMIALSDPDHAIAISDALRQAGAVRTIVTQISPLK